MAIRRISMLGVNDIGSDRNNYRDRYVFLLPTWYLRHARDQRPAALGATVFCPGGGIANSPCTAVAVLQHQGGQALVRAKIM